jgi:hypothetical protein
MPTSIIGPGGPSLNMYSKAMPGVGIESFYPGWQRLINSAQSDIYKYLTYAKIDTTEADLVTSSLYNNPTGGTWVASNISISSGPTVSTLNSFASDDIIEGLINSQTKFIDTTNPPPLNEYIFLQGNSTSTQNIKNTLSFDFGSTLYTNIQISFINNCVRAGDKDGKIRVFDFPLASSITGVKELELIFNEYTGPLLLGIRLESSTGQSSIFKLRTFILPSQ